MTRVFARVIVSCAFASMGAMLLGPDVVSAASAFSTMQNTGGSSPRGKVCDTWNVSGIANGTSVTVDLRGSASGGGSLGDPYLHVFDESNVQRGADDDAGAGLDSRLTITWFSGYYIGASVYSSGLGATYTLSTSAGQLTKSTRLCSAPPKQNQTITFNNPGTRTFGTSFNLSATATSGLAVSFSSSTTNVCTVSGTTLNTVSTGTCSITASQAGNGSWNAAPNVLQSFTIGRASQTITFGTPPNRTYSPTAFGLSATATSGLTVTFTSQTPTTCSVSGANLTMLASGNCTVRASQAGNTLYTEATSVDRTFAISQASQTISYTNPGQRVSQGTFTTSATATSGLAVAFSSQTTGVCTTGGSNGSTVTLVGVGTCTIRASQVGDTRFLAALNVDQSFTVVPADQTVTFNLTGVSRTYGDADFDVTATASSNLTPVLSSTTPGVCSVAGFTVQIRAAGTCSITANQAGNTVYNPAPAVARSFTVAQKPLTAPSIAIASRPYNGTRVPGAVTLGNVSGLVGNEQLVITPAAGDYASANVGSPVSTVTFSLANGSNGGIAANYSMANVDVTGQITARQLLVTANDVARTADDAVPTFGVAALGLVDGESVSGSSFSFVTVSAGSLVNGAPDHRVVGRYTVTPTSITLANSRPTTNYAITYVAADYRVTAGEPKKLVVPAFSGTAASGQVFSVQPRVTVTDQYDNRIITGAGSVASVTAAITSGAGGSLIGSVTAEAADGVASFVNLGLAGLTSQTYTITFSSTVDGNAMVVATQQVTPTHGVATQLGVVGNITAQVATSFPSAVSVAVLDAQGNAVTNSTAVVTVVPSGGELVGTKTVTATNGTASFGGLKLNAPVGAYTLSYSSPGLASVTQSATVEAGPAAKMELVTRAVGTRAGDPFTTPPSIRLTDSVGNPVLVAGNTVTATITRVNSTGALLSSGVESTTVTAQTDANGVATFTGLGIVGLENTTYTITFSSTVNGVVIPTARQLITVTPGPVRAFVVDRGVSGAASRVVATTQPRIKVLDQGGNLVTNPNDQVTVSATGDANGNVYVDSTPVRSVGGYATFTDVRLFGLVGTHSVRFTLNGDVLAQQNGIALVAGPAARVVTTSAVTVATSGQAFSTPTVVRVADADGNLVSDSTVNVTAEVRSNDSRLIGTVTRPVINGSATFTGLGLRGTVGVYEIWYYVNELAHASQTVTLSHGAPAQLSVSTSASGARAGSAMGTQPVVRILDAEGNLVTSGAGSTATVTVVSSVGSTLSGTTSVAAVGGVATFSNLRLDGRSGTTYSLTFRSTVGSTTLTSASHTVLMATGDPHSLRLAQPAVGTRAGEVFTTQPSIELLDVSGNVVSASADTVTVSASAGATLLGVTSAQASSGVATFNDLGISGVSGTTYTLTFRSGSRTAVTQTVRVTPGAPVSLHLERSSSTSVGSGATLSVQPRIEIRDAAGNRVTDSSALVTASVASGASTVGSTRVGAMTGLATFASLGLNGTAGTSYTVTYSSPNLTSVTQSVTVNVGAAVKLKLDTAASATGNSGVALSTQPVVTLRDSGDNLVTGSVSTITATASAGGSLANSSRNTSNGQATFSGLAITARTGTYTITYSAPNLAPVSQTITVNPGNAARIVVDPQAKNVKAASGVPFDIGGSVRIVDSAGNTVSSSATIRMSAAETSPITNSCGSSSSSGGTTTVTFYSGCSWKVPRGVTSVAITAYGGAGGQGGRDGEDGGLGGAWGVAGGSISVAANDVIGVYPGGNGGNGASSANNSGGGQPGYSTYSSAFNGGWGGNAGSYGSSGGGGGGGAASVVLVRGTYALVAGGAGGGGGDSNKSTATPGTSGSLIAGFTGGNGTFGGACDGTDDGGGGGGGGGGWNGGRGGDAPYVNGECIGYGGNQGSNHIAAGLTNTTNSNSWSSPGTIFISYSTPLPPVLQQQGVATSSNILDVAAVAGSAPLSSFSVSGVANTTYTVTYTVPSLGITSDTQSVELSAGTASKVTNTVAAAGSRSGSAFITQPVIAVQDSSGNLVASSAATVSATVIGDNASSVTLGGTTTINAASGIASFSGLSLTGTAGTYTIQYSADLGSSTVTTSATIVLEAGTAAKLLTSGASTSTAGGTIPSFTVNVADASDNTVATAIVEVGVEITSGPLNWSTASLLTGRTTMSAVNGVATFNDLSIGGVAGTYTLTIRSTGLPDITRTVTLQAAAPSYMTLSQFDGDVPSGDVMTPAPEVSFFDAFGNPTSLSGSVTATLSTVDIAGTTTGTFGGGTSRSVSANGLSVSFGDVTVSGRAGQQYMIVFEAAGLTPVVGLVSVSAGAPTSMVVIQEAADANSSLPLGVQPVVELRDSGDNRVVSSSDTVSMTSSTLTFGNASKVAVGGQVTFTDVTVSGSPAITHTVTYSATIGSSTITTTQSLGVAAGAPDRLAVVTAPNGAQSGAAFTTQPVLEIQDADGNRVTTLNGSVSVAVSGTPTGTPVGDVTAPIVSGRATFESLGLSGRINTNYTLAFTGTASGLTFGNSTTVTVSAGAPAVMELTTPASGAAAGVSFSAQPRITVLDEGGNPVSSATTVTASASVGGTLIGATTVSAVNGVADFTDLGLTGSAGSSYVLTYSAADLRPVTQTIQVVIGPPTAVAIVQAASGARSGDVLSTVPQVRLVDAGGNAVSASAIVEVAMSGGSLGGPTTSATDASGAATFAGLIVNGAMGAEYTLTYSATLNGVALNPATQTIRAQLGAPAQVVLANSPSGTQSGVAFTDAPVLEIQDAGGNVIADSSAPIEATVTKVDGSPGGVLIGTTTRQSVGGVATFSDLGITGTSGQTYRITFASTGLQSATHDLTVSTGPATQLAITSAPPTASAGVVFDPPMVVEIRDSGGNVVSSTSQVVATVNGGGTLVGSVVGDAVSGVARFGSLGISGTTGNTPTVTFSVPGLQSVSQQVTISAGPAARLVITSETSARVAPSGGEFSLEPRIRIEDAGGNLVDDDATVVTASVTPISVGGAATGVLVGTVTATATNGLATFGTLGLTGKTDRSYTVTYTASVNGQPLAAATEVITVTTGAAVRLELTRPSIGNAVGEAFTTQPIVTVFDTGDNVVASPGVDVVASVSAGASLIGTSAIGASTGVAAFSDLGIVGIASSIYTVTYSAMNGSTPVASIAPVSQQITPRVGAPSSLVITRPINSSPASGTPFTQQPIVTVVDAGGNTVTSSNTPVEATVAPIAVNGVSTGELSGTRTVNAADGVVLYTDLALTGKSNLAYTVTFTATLSGTPSTVTQSVQPSSGAAHSLGFVTPAATAPAGEAFLTQPVLEVLDSAGNRALNSSRRVTVDVSSGATFVGSTFVDAVSGLVTFGGLGLTGTAGTSYTLTFESGSITSVTQSVTVGTGRPTRLVLDTTSSATVPAGGPFATQPVLRIEDAGGNLVSSGNGAVLSVTASVDPLDVGGVTTGLATGTTSTTAVGGIATFSGLGMGGRTGVDYTMRYSASYDGVSLAPATQVVAPTNGSATSLRIKVAASGAVVGLPLAVQPRIEAVDAFDNVVVNGSVIVMASISDGASLVGSTSRGTVGGEVVYTDLSARGIAGTSPVITYSATGLTSVTQSVSLLAGPPTRLLLERSAVGAASGRAFTTSPRVWIVDSFGNRTTSNATVSASITQVAGAGVLTGTRELAAVNGEVIFADLGVDGRAGTSYAMRFSSLGLSGTSQTIQVDLGEPTSIEFVQRSIGSSVGTAFAQQPRLVLKDAGDNVLVTSTASVSATVDQAGGSLLGTTTVNVVNGFASFTNLGILGANNTDYTVRYTSGTLSATQLVRALTGPALSLQIAQASDGHTDGAIFSTQPRISLRDAAGNLVVETGANVTATVAGPNGALIGSATRPVISGVAAFTNLGIDGTPNEQYVLTYASPGLFSVTESVTVSAALPGLVPQFATVSATVDGFRVDMINHDSTFSVTGIASSNGRVSVVDLDGTTRRFIVSGIGPDTAARLTVTTTKAGHTSETSFVDGRSQLRAGLVPQFGAPVVTNDGFSVQINNYSSAYIWSGVSSAGGRVVISPSGRLTVTGLAGGVTVSATVTTSRTGYLNASATTASITTLEPPLVPTFGTPVSAEGGFTVQVTNYDPLFNYATFITPAGSVTISASGLVTVGGLSNGTGATVLVTTSRAGHSNGSAAVIGRSLGAALTPSFATPQPAPNGWSVVVTNYDANFTWSPSVTAGTAQLSVANGTATVTVTNSGDSSTLTLTTSRSGFLPGSASVSFAREPGLVPIFGSPTSITGGFTVPIVNFDPDFTWTVASSAGTATMGTSGTVTVSASLATITVTSSRPGNLSRSATFTKGSSTALVPTLATVSASTSGFVLDITNHDPSYTWTVQSTRGTAVVSGSQVTVTGLAPGQSTIVVVSSNRDGYDTGNESISYAAQSNPGLVPVIGTPTATVDGFTAVVTNYDPAYTWRVQNDGTIESRIEPTGTSTALVTVAGVSGGSSATVTVVTSREGYEDGSATVTAATQTGGGSLAVFGPPTATPDGFTVQVTNYDPTYTWAVSVSPVTSSATASISPSGLITVIGLGADELVTVTVETSRTNRFTRSVSFTAGSLTADGSPSVALGRTPTFGTVTPTTDGFTARITNYSSLWSWSVLSSRDATVSVSSQGILTVRGLAPGISNTVVVVTNADGYSTGTAALQGTALGAGARAANLLTEIPMLALCPNGSPDGEGVSNLTDLVATTRYSCYTSSTRGAAPLSANTIGFATGDVSTSVLTSITFTSAPDNADRDPLTYTLWGCQAENLYCSIIISNDSTGITSARSTDFTRTFRNTRAFSYYRVTFGSMRGSSNVVQLSEVSFGGTSGLPAGLTPTFDTPTVSANGFSVQVANFSRLYTWQVSVPAPGRAAIDANGVIRVENLVPNSTNTLTVTTRRAGFADATSTLTVMTSNGSALIPVIGSVQATEDGLRALIENFDAPGFTWSASSTIAGSTTSAGVAQISSNGIVTVTGATPGSSIRLTVTTERTGYLTGSNFVDETVLNDLGLIMFGSPTPLTSGYTVQVSNYAASDANGTFEWRVIADSGAIAAIDGSGLITVSNLGTGATARVTVIRSQVGALSTSGSITGRSIGILIPEFGSPSVSATGFTVDITNFDPAFTWSATASAGSIEADWTLGRVTVSAVPDGVSSVLTVSASRTGFTTGEASIGSNLEPPIVPVFSTPVETSTGFTTSITNWSTVSATNWNVQVSPAGTVQIDGNGNIIVAGAVRGEVTTVTVNTASSGRSNGRGNVIFTVGARPGLTPSFGSPIPIVDGYSVQIANFNPDFAWSAVATDGASAAVSSTGLVTVVDVPDNATVTVTVFTSRSGYQSASASITGSSRIHPGLVPVFGVPTVTGTGVTVQIENYDPTYNWSAAVDNDGLVTISTTGRVTVTDLPGFTMATIVVTTSRAGFSDQTGTLRATTLAGEPLVPRFTISTSNADGFVVRLRNFDPRYEWYVTSPLPGVVGNISSDGLLTVSGATTGALVPIEVRTERAGFQSGIAEFSAVAQPIVANTIGPVIIERYAVSGGVATLETRTPHGFAVGDWIVVANLGPTMDGDYRVASIPSTSSVTFLTGAADTVAVGGSMAEVVASGPVDGEDPVDSGDTGPEQGESNNPQPAIEGESSIQAASVASVASGLAWVTPEQTSYVQLSETTVPVDLVEDEAANLLRAFVTIPSGVASDGASLTVIPAMTEEALAGYHMVRIDGDSGGVDVTQLNDVVRILFEPPAPGAVPVQSSDDGLTWAPLPRLSGPSLPIGVNDGYYVNPDGTVWIFTRHLSYFGFLAEQSVPLDIVGVPSSLLPNSTSQLTVEGGEGEGEVTLTSLTPAVCTVDALGYFTAVTNGNCSLRATKGGSGRYLEATMIASYTVGSTSTSTPGGDLGGGAPDDDSTDDENPDDGSNDGENPDDGGPSTETPDDGNTGGSGPLRPGSGSSTSAPGSNSSSGSGSSGSTGDTTSPPSQSEIDAVSEQTRTPLPPGSGSPAVDQERPIVVIENGEIVEVDVTPAPDGDGLVIRGPGFEVLVRGVDADGKPIPLDGDLRLVIERGQSITVSGSGYAPNSIVTVFLFSTAVELGEVTTDENGSFSATFMIPEDVEPGDHTVQINGVSPDGELRTLNALITVEEGSESGTSVARVVLVIVLVIGLGILMVLVGAIAVSRRRRVRIDSPVTEPDASS